MAAKIFSPWVEFDPCAKKRKSRQGATLHQGMIRRQGEKVADSSIFCSQGKDFDSRVLFSEGAAPCPRQRPCSWGEKARVIYGGGAGLPASGEVLKRPLEKGLAQRQHPPTQLA